MSFTRLLAAGRSVMGIAKEPSPYRVNEDYVLPNFARLVKGQAAFDAKPAAAAAPSEELIPPQTPVAATLPGSAGPTAVSSLAPKQPEPRKRRTIVPAWAKRLVRLGRQKGKNQPARATAGPPVQTELALAGVKVMRNDLADWNFEVAAEPAKPAVPAAPAKVGPGRPLGMVWNRLSARLLRQAAEDFSSVQKQRGKLFTQTGPSDGSSRRT